MQTDGREATVQVVSSGPRSLVLELAIDSFSAADGTIEVPGLDRLAEQGEPDLPGRIVLVGVPQQGEVRLAVSTSQTEALAGMNVRPAAGYDTRRQDAAYRIQGGGGAWPGQPAELLSVEVYRDVRVAKVRINPVQYDAGSGTVRLHRRVRVSLSFDEPATSSERPGTLDRVLEQMLVNGKEAVTWKLDPPEDQDSLNFFERSDAWCRVKTETTGVYRVTPAMLKAAGFAPDDIDPATMKLYMMGPHAVNGPYPDTMVELPVYLKENGDGKFNSSDLLAFYVESPSYWQDDTTWRFNPFTSHQYAWLTWGGAPGRRMETVAASASSNPRATGRRHVRLERDDLCPARSGLLWLQERFFKPAGQDTGGASVELKLAERETVYTVAGRFYGDYVENALVRYPVALFFNGALLDTISVSARSSRPPATDFSFSGFPAEVAARGTRTDSLRIRLQSLQEEDVYLDYIEVRYAAKLKVSAAQPFVDFIFTEPGAVDFGIEGATGEALLLDVTDPYAPKLVAGTGTSGSSLTCRLEVPGFTRMACVLPSRARTPDTLVKRAPGRLRSTAEQADYYIVCPDEFGAAAELLARYRQNNVSGMAGARVRVARLGDIYDDYSFGIEEPGAIKKFLSAKRPTYVLLAGDGDYDYKNALGLARPPGVPAYELGYDIDPEVYSQEAKALDAWYVDFDGQGSSPDLVLGRVTARSAQELRLFLDKLRRYETQAPGSWSKRIILLADDEYLGDPTKPDGIGFAHIGGCEQIARLTSPLLDPAKIYLTEYSPVEQRGSASHDALQAEMKRGALLWCFFGHGAGFQLNHEMTLHITNSVPSISNGSRTPLAFYGSCGVGRFDDTKYASIAEELVRKEDGCIATAGATKATSPGGNETFARTWVSSLVNNPSDPVGLSYYRAWGANTLYHLFGEPATMLRTPVQDSLPQVSPDTFYPGGRNTVTASPPAASGMYEISVFEQQWARSYRSDVGSASYELPGYELHRSLGSFDTNLVSTSFVVPTISYPETTIVPNGSYIREPSTCRVSLLGWSGREAWSSLRGGIALGDPVAAADQEPPDISLFADGRPLSPTETTEVMADFTLGGTVRDESGILLVPIPDVMLSAAVGSASRVHLGPYFAYDKNSTTTGRFSYPVALANPVEVITVVASDNLVDPSSPGLNRRVLAVPVKTKKDDALRITDALVYPNPAAGAAQFTFSISRPALVSVRIFTLAGRLVRWLELRQCGFGYNQLDWDGRDKDGLPLANGVYLYKLDARATDNSGSQSTSASVRDKFIVHR